MQSKNLLELAGAISSGAVRVVDLTFTLSPDTTACAIARGASFGGGTVWNHSMSTGPVKRFRTLTPPGRSSARRQCDSDRHAACEAE